MAETDYLSTALAAASKGRTQKAQTPEENNEDTHEESSDVVGEGHHVAAREMIDCHNAGDHEGYARALHSFVKMSQ